MTPITERVWEILQRRSGRENGIACFTLAAHADATERDVRKAITELREAGVAVCGHPKDGYFIAATSAELEDTCRFLRCRALHSLRLEAGMRKTTMLDLLGQLQFEFDQHLY